MWFSHVYLFPPEWIWPLPSWIRASMIIYISNLLISGYLSLAEGLWESKSLRNLPKTPLSSTFCRRWNVGKVWGSGGIAPSMRPMRSLQRHGILCVIREVNGILQLFQVNCSDSLVNHPYITSISPLVHQAVFAWNLFFGWLVLDLGWINSFLHLLRKAHAWHTFFLPTLSFSQEH